MKKILLFCLTILCLVPSLLFVGCGEAPKEKLEIVKPFVTTYYLNEEINLSGSKLRYSYEDKRSVEIDITSEMISNFTTKSFGTRNLKLTYLDKSIDVKYTVLNLIGQNFENRECVNEQNSIVSCDIVTTYSFNRDGSVVLTNSNGEIKGQYSILADGTIQITNSVKNTLKIVNFARTSATSYKCENLEDGLYKILDFVN